MPERRPIRFRPLSKTDAERFWSLVQRGEPNDCWPWLGGKNNEGYGSFRRAGRALKAHRVAYSLAKGPTRKFVLHSCDWPPCCNPAHLHAGSKALNSVEAVQRQRKAMPEGIKVTAQQAVAIRLRYRAGGITQAALGEAYGLTQSAVSRIVSEDTWYHV